MPVILGASGNSGSLPGLLACPFVLMMQLEVSTVKRQKERLGRRGHWSARLPPRGGEDCKVYNHIPQLEALKFTVALAPAASLRPDSYRTPRP